MKISIKLFLILSFCFSSISYSHTYSVIGDAGVWNNFSRQVRDSIMSSNIKKLILPGDNIYITSQEYEEVWGPWLDNGLQFSVVALGNHHRSIEEEIEFFNMPGKYFSKVENNIRFIVLDSETLTELDKQASFLNEELQQSNEMFNVIVFHHPMATISYRHGWKEREAFHLKMKPIIEKHKRKINLIINGHDHLASLFTFNDIPVIVSGAVFESRPAPAFNYTREDGSEVVTKWTNDQGFYWVRLDFDESKNRLWVNFVRSDIDEVSCSILLIGHDLYRKTNCFKTGHRGDSRNSLEAETFIFPDLMSL